MEFGVIVLVLAVGYIVHRAFSKPRPTLEVALEHIERGSPVRAEYVAEQALRAARGPADKGEAGVVLAHVLLRVGDPRRAREALEAATPLLREAGRTDALRAAEAHLEEIDEALSVAPEPEADEEALWLTLGGPDSDPPAADGPAVADRCASGGCGCGPAGVVDAEASSAFARLLAEGRASDLVKAAEIRRDGDALVPRVTVNGELSAEQERTLDQAVRGAMGVLFG